METLKTPWKDALSFLVRPLIAGQPYDYRTEHDLHRAVSGTLGNAGVRFAHEFALTSTERIDFISRGVGIEVKTTGTIAEVGAQLRRYGNTGRLSALMLVTTCAEHRRVPVHGYGVPTAIIHVYAWRRWWA
ncbi:hypothetical protein ABT299_44915 [Spirillospora sp. NPDC000708]